MSSTNLNTSDKQTGSIKGLHLAIIRYSSSPRHLAVDVGMSLLVSPLVCLGSVCQPSAIVLSGGDRPLVEVIGSKGIALMLMVLLGVLDEGGLYRLVLAASSP